MLKSIVFILAIFISSSVHSSILNIPSRDELGYKAYNWLNNSYGYYLDVNFQGEAEDIITKNSVERLFKLQMKNFVRDINLDTFTLEEPDTKLFNNRWMHLTLDLRKYNDHNNIYYGTITLEIEPDVTTNGLIWQDRIVREHYLISTPIANAKYKMKDTIQSYLNEIIQVLAEDYYWIEEYSANNDENTK